MLVSSISSIEGSGAFPRTLTSRCPLILCHTSRRPGREAPIAHSPSGHSTGLFRRAPKLPVGHQDGSPHETRSNGGLATQNAFTEVIMPVTPRPSGRRISRLRSPASNPSTTRTPAGWAKRTSDVRRRDGSRAGGSPVRKHIGARGARGTRGQSPRLPPSRHQGTRQDKSGLPVVESRRCPTARALMTRTPAYTMRAR